VITETVHVVRSADGATTHVVRDSGDGASSATVLALLAAQAATDAGTYVPLALLAADPDQMATGTITRGTSLGVYGAATGFAVVWPDGATGVYAGTESTTCPGAVDHYTVTYVPASGPTKTYTQPTVTRDAGGAVTNRPAMTVS
jgi:hypothetical protein